MNLNKVILVGRIGSDVRVFQTPQGIQYARLTLAVNRRTTTNKEIADYIPIIAWRNTADFIGSYLNKGDLVVIEGNLQSSQYQDTKTNQLVRALDVVVDSIQPLETRETRDTRRQKSGQTMPQNYQNTYKSSVQNGQSNLPKTNQKPSFSEVKENNIPNNSEGTHGFFFPPMDGDDEDDDL